MIRLLFIIPILSFSQIQIIFYCDNPDDFPNCYGKTENGEWEGTIKDGVFWTGNGKEITQFEYLDKNGEKKKGTQTFEGKMKEGKHYHGSLIRSSLCGGVEKIKFDSVAGRNDRNYYNRDHILGRYTSTIVSLRQEKNTYYVELKFGKIKKDFVFDTGAESFSISKEYWNEIKDDIDYENLNICTIGEGVGGSVKVDLFLIKDGVQIGEGVDEYKVNNVVIGVSDSKYSLLGISFFKKFKDVEWGMVEKELKLYK